MSRDAEENDRAAQIRKDQVQWCFAVRFGRWGVFRKKWRGERGESAAHCVCLIVGNNKR